MLKDNYKYNVWLFGTALGNIVEATGKIKLAIFSVKIRATREIDYQYDGGFCHDEGGYDYDLSCIEPEYPDEYEVIDLIMPSIKDGDSTIKHIINIYEIYNEYEGRIIEDDDDWFWRKNCRRSEIW